MSKTTILKPHLSEKTYDLSKSSVYVFAIEPGVNKHTVERAVEAQFEVKVKAVNLLNYPGKAKRIISISGKRTKNASGSRNATRKAYVTLQEGYSLPLFDAVEEASKQEQETQEKITKAQEKQAKKESKTTVRKSIRKTKEETA